MVEHGTYLVPTLAAPRCILDAGVEKGMKDYVLRKANLVVDAHIESFKKAYQRGVKTVSYTHRDVYKGQAMRDARSATAIRAIWLS